MRRITAGLVATAALAAVAFQTVHAEDASSRVIVSTTLNDTLQLFDASTLAELQPPLPSRGGGPVRLWVQDIDQQTYLFAANHGVAIGSVGVFDLSGDLVTELPLSPFPARPGSVGITATEDSVFITNTYHALAGCDVPAGTVGIYDTRMLPTLGVLIEEQTFDVSGAQPWAVSVDPTSDRAFVSSNCSDTLDSVNTGGIIATRATGNGPDATVWDAAHGLNLTVNISGSSVSVHDAASPGALTTIPLPGARPIDATLAESPGGARWLITSNGGDDSISLVDRDLIAACVDEAAMSCDAEVARIQTAVPGGAPEGVAYDPVTNRAFVVNKTFPPSLSVIQLTEHPDGAVTGSDIAQIPLNALGTSVPIPGIIAFDVVIQTR